LAILAVPFLIMAVIGLPILFVPGWRSFALAVVIYSLVLTAVSVSQPDGLSCTAADCGVGEVSGYLIGLWWQIAAWAALGTLTIIKVVLLATRNLGRRSTH